MMITRKTFLGVTLGLISFDIVVYLIRLWHKSISKKKEMENDCIIFHLGVYDCGPYCPAEVDLLKNNGMDCASICLRKIIKPLEECKYCIEFALYRFLSPQFLDIVVLLALKGRSVRIIVDSNEYTNIEHQIPEISKKGVQIKRSNSQFFFHHKFIIIDKRLLYQGSSNFTNSSIHGNCDNVLLTADTLIVEKYSQYFESLWKELPA